MCIASVRLHTCKCNNSAGKSIVKNGLVRGLQQYNNKSKILHEFPCMQAYMNASVTRVSTATRRASQDEHCFTPRFWTGSFVLGPVAWVEAALGIWFFFYLLLSRASLTRVLAQRLYRSMKSGSLCKLSQGGGGVPLLSLIT